VDFPRVTGGTITLASLEAGQDFKVGLDFILSGSDLIWVEGVATESAF
jgi:hypothetical protein